MNNKKITIVINGNNTYSHSQKKNNIFRTFNFSVVEHLFNDFFLESYSASIYFNLAVQSLLTELHTRRVGL